jgi:hypothetical protein
LIDILITSALALAGSRQAFKAFDLEIIELRLQEYQWRAASQQSPERGERSRLRV